MDIKNRFNLSPATADRILKDSQARLAGTPEPTYTIVDSMDDVHDVPPLTQAEYDEMFGNSCDF